MLGAMPCPTDQPMYEDGNIPFTHAPSLNQRRRNRTSPEAADSRLAIAVTRVLIRTPAPIPPRPNEFLTAAALTQW
jgi:hypothetical protein